MYKNKLYRTALLSSPIMAAFELSPTFFLQTHGYPLNFWFALATLTILTIAIWGVNIYVMNIWIKSGRKNNTEWYALSYIFTLLLFALLWIIVHLFPELDDSRSRPSIIFPIINILALNTIILIISNAITVRSKSEQVDKELAKLKIKNLEAEQQVLVGQMQPHFLFNALSTLSSIISSDPDLAKKYVIRLSNFLRYTISAHEHVLIPLSEELKFTQDYIELQKIRFEDSFYCSLTIPNEQIIQYQIPVYALQSLVENTFKHNSFSDKKPLKVSIELKDDQLIVSNNKMLKPVFLDGERKGVGLKNLNKRYQLIVGKDIDIKDTQTEYTVTLKLIQTMP
ncbi:sensor histidine kinase [Bacteroides ihuae]|uniref:sensor histidine kinase n=1 Tax=Bacteroides ihuae TaxID=1852362 RepID=UPI00098F78A7|nr:histidine kinase [Bacteroides ihuae]